LHRHSAASASCSNRSKPARYQSAIDGYALGGGPGLALACDLRFASSATELGFPQSRLGLIPGWNGAQRLVEIVGRSAALQLLYTGEIIGVADALRLGLIDDSSDGNGGAAVARVCSTSKRCRAALTRRRQICWSGCNAAIESGGENVTLREFERLWFTKDRREAEAAFVEKRTPKFRGE
jgi:enoyl-CoA hydratase